MSNELNQIKAFSGSYYRWALEARKKYVSLRLKQDPEIRNLYLRAVRRIAKEIRTMTLGTPSAQLRKKQLEKIEALLKAEAGILVADLTNVIEAHINAATNAGTAYSQNIMVDAAQKSGVVLLTTKATKALYLSVNRQAIEACWARTNKGLFLSDRIWQQGENMHITMRNIIQEAVAIGQDAVKTARMLEQYVKTSTKTIAGQYPNMMKRMGGRIPNDISYEALRLARTEMTAAFGEGTVAAAKVTPSYKGMKWVLSKSHPVADICDSYAAHDEGLGHGVYAPGNEPPYPGHPNCLCVLIAVHEQPDEFVNRLKKWQENPSSDAKLEEWYQNIYKKGLAG